MSVQAIAWVLEHSTLKGAHRCVMVSIANQLGPDGSGWVYIRRVLGEANCSRGTYRAAVQQAEAAGELRRLPFEGGGARLHDRHRPNLFVFPALHETPGVVAPHGPVQGLTGERSGPTSDVKAVFTAWVQATGRDAARVKLTEQRRKRIAARLKDGYSVADLTDAVHGVTRSDFHMGKNDLGQRYDDIGTVLRDGAQVEKFRDLWRAADTGLVLVHPALRPERGCDHCDRGFIVQDNGDVVVCSYCTGGSQRGMRPVRQQVEKGAGR